MGKSTAPRSGPPPPLDCFKLNFDGASRGNPGPAGFGAVLRDHMGKIIHMIAGFLGENTNNVAELTSLVRGLQTAVHHQYHRLVIEGDPDGVTRRDRGTGGCALDPGINADGRHPRVCINDG
jgi:ribonuclease HI